MTTIEHQSEYTDVLYDFGMLHPDIDLIVIY
jgi:hypothetical protein